MSSNGAHINAGLSSMDGVAFYYLSDVGHLALKADKIHIQPILAGLVISELTERGGITITFVLECRIELNLVMRGL